MTPVPLDDDAVHVWTLSLDDTRLDAWSASLSESELDTAQRLRQAVLQERWRRCRGALRAVLGTYLARSPSAVDIAYSRFGKPYLADEPLHFNVSHSGERALIGVSRLPLGIDVELADDRAMQLDNLIGLIAHPAERAAYQRLAHGHRAERFFGLWTRKEAYVKAIGTGLQTSLTDCWLISANDASHAVCDRDGAALGWHTHDLDSDSPAWRAALSVTHSAPRVSHFSITNL